MKVERGDLVSSSSTHPYELRLKLSVNIYTCLLCCDQLYILYNIGC